MKKKYELKNIKANDFFYKLEALLETKSVTVNYLFEAGINILTLEGSYIATKCPS